VRQVLTVSDPNTFTVLAVTSQTNGDTFSKFDTAATVGVEGLTDETTVDYLSNYNEKSVRAGSNTTTIVTGIFLRFEYNEVVPIRVQRTDNASIATLKSLIQTDGIFDGSVITDNSIDSSTMASERAQAELEQYSNPIVSGSFQTDQEGLRAGQIIRITDSNRAVNADYLIQAVKASSEGGEDGSYWIYDIEFASSLFGIIEFFQKLLATDAELQVEENEIVDQITAEEVTITIGEANAIVPDESASEAATVTVGESNVVTEFTPPYQWEPSTGQPIATKWNLFQWQ
jgi:hypothetical protein